MTKANPVVLPKDISKALRKISNKSSLPANVVERSKIILMCADGMKNAEIAKALGISANTVSKWRNRFINSEFSAYHPRYVSSQDPPDNREKILEQELIRILTDDGRSGHPTKFTTDQIVKIQNLACELPKDHGIEATKWTLTDLRDKAEEEGIVDSISPATIARFLKEGKIQPHLYRYWLNSADKKEDRKAFDRKVKLICELYLAAYKLYSGGYYVVSGDEMTGIQALERLYPDKPTARGHKKGVEFEYIRHGTISMITFFMVATGRVFRPYLKETRTETDFVAAVQEVVDTDKAAHWIFIVDGLNIHKSEALVRYVAKECDINEDLGKKGVRGILHNMGSRAEFLSNPYHRIIFVYTPRHCSWLNQIEIWFSRLSRRLLKNSSYKSVEDLVKSILRFVDQYNKTAHPYRWKYKGTT